MLDLQEYGVTKKWVHVLEMVALEDHIEEVVVLDVVAPACVDTFICVEMKTNTETVALRMLQKVQTTLVPQVQFFFIIVEGVFEGRLRQIFFLAYSSSRPCLTYYQPYESM